jgi:hypothetical protein
MREGEREGAPKEKIYNANEYCWVYSTIYARLSGSAG